MIRNYKLLCSALLCISALASCRPDVHESAGDKRFFDLKGFINADSARLNRAHITVTKTVAHNNDVAQTKPVTITNWGQELSAFSASDINKPAWRDGYSVKQEADSVVYTALMPDLVTRRMVIQQNDKAVKKIHIENFTKNLLYQTTEHLVYYPDSVYLIDKLQEVKLLGSNRYVVKGVMK
ncbi:hypothetical protein [Mucilaginibacter terrae]|uniref:hypothetical protein n=1 Tax=Mucilaginibacter terrae TaxID=1955052 RepID=UPI00289A062A|nr:hypothetical protein [Mucilaginibacter terrae]